MTKDELRKEATFTVEWESTPMIDRPLFVHAYITGAEPREKRIAELELKIKHLTEHLEPQAMTALFEQVEEEVKQEQRLNELEKENAELKQEKIPQLERKIASIHGAHSVDCKKLNARTEQVERLKKENAELKENNKVYTIGEGETLVVNVSFDKFTRINANNKMYYPRNNDLGKENTDLKEVSE